MTNTHETTNDEFSSIGMIECPHCGTEAMIESVHATGEENIQCHNCGYGRRLAFTNGSFEIKEQQAFGAYRVEMIGSPRLEAGSFTHRGAAQAFESMMETIKDRVAYASYSQYIDGQIVTKEVINKTNK